MSFKCIITTTAAENNLLQSTFIILYIIIKVGREVKTVIIFYCPILWRDVCQHRHSSQVQIDAIRAAAWRRVLNPLRRKSKASNLTSVLAPSLTMNAARLNVYHRENLHTLIHLKAGQFYVCYAQNASSLSFFSFSFLRQVRWTDRWVNSDCRNTSKISNLSQNP